MHVPRFFCRYCWNTYVLIVWLWNFCSYSLRNVAQCAISCVCIWMLIPFLFPCWLQFPCYPFVFLSFFFHSNVEPRWNNRKEARWRASLKFERHARWVSPMNFTRYLITVTFLCRRNKENAEEEYLTRQKNLLPRRENAPTRMLVSCNIHIYLHRSYTLTICWYRSPACSLVKNVICHVQSPWKLRLFQRYTSIY